jgi:glycolate oxidase iron-sulfur subunit
VTLPSTSPTPSGWFDAEDAPNRRDIGTCIHCGLCLTACPTYRELKIEPDSPRGRIYLMRGLAEGRIEPDPDVVHHLDLCLGCRACETVCPAGVPYGRMLEETRGQLSRRVVKRSGAGALGTWALTTLFPNRGLLHAAADALRLGQGGPIAAFMRSSLAARLVPAFARQGYAMTPPIAPRGERAIERVASRLPAGARMTTTADAFTFSPAATPRARVAFFTTCVMEVMFPEVNREAVRLLVLAGCEVVVPRAQTCCGALHAHAGLRREAKTLATRNVAVFAAATADFIVTDSAGCGAAMREFDHLLHGSADAEAAKAFAARVRDVSEVLAEVGLPASTQRLASARGAGPLRVGYHDPCHLAHAQRVRSQPRRLLGSLDGVELVELPNSDWCCGSAGVYNLTHADMADAQLERKLDSIERAGVEVVIASNPGCSLHMARGARERGLAVRIEHLVDVLARAYPVTARS